jgi:hypothetical protein
VAKSKFHRHQGGGVNLPATLEQAQAINFVRETVRHFREHDISEIINVRAFESESGRRFAREIMKQFAARHVDNTMLVADWARQGWTLADEALRQLFRELTDRGETSVYLSAYVMEVTRGQIRHRPAPRAESQYFRNVIIVSMIIDLVEKFDLKPTRNPTTQRKLSACSIVAEVLGMSEPAVVAVWLRTKKSWYGYG